jgi:hypothetical protein
VNKEFVKSRLQNFDEDFDELHSSSMQIDNDGKIKVILTASIEVLAQ